MVVWKYLRFVLLCFGYWTDDVVEMYHVHQRLQATSLVWTHPHFKDNESTNTAREGRPSFLQQQHMLAGSAEMARGWLSWTSHGGKETESLARIPEVTLKHMYQDDYSAALSTIVSTRACLLQLVPGLALLSIFANLTSIAPMLVQSKELELSLPEVVISHVKAVAYEVESEFTHAVNKIRKQELHEDDFCVPVPRAADPTSIAVVEEHNEATRIRMRTCMAQPELLVKTWVVRMRTIMLYVSHSRGFTFLYELVQFFFILVLLFGLNTPGSMSAFIALTIVLLFPVCLIHALSCYILIGKVLAITDKDIDQFCRFCHCLSCFRSSSWEQEQIDTKKGHFQVEPQVGIDVKTTVNPLTAIGEHSAPTLPVVGFDRSPGNGVHSLEFANIYQRDTQEGVNMTANPLDPNNIPGIKYQGDTQEGVNMTANPLLDPKNI